MRRLAGGTTLNRSVFGPLGYSLEPLVGTFTLKYIEFFLELSPIRGTCCRYCGILPPFSPSHVVSEASIYGFSLISVQIFAKKSPAFLARRKSRQNKVYSATHNECCLCRSLPALALPDFNDLSCRFIQIHVVEF